MTAFVVVAALMTLSALAFVLPPLLKRRVPLAEDRDAANAALYREQLAELEREHAAGSITDAAWQESRREIERRLLEDVSSNAAAAATPAPSVPPRGIAVAVGILVPALAIAGYLLVGTPAALDPVARIAPDAAHKVTPEQVAAMIERLAERLKKNPEDVEGWAMLARSYAVTGNHDGAVKAYETLAKLVPDNADVLADYADSLAMMRGRKLAGEPLALVKKALVIDPKHVKALALAGSAEFEMKNFAGAVTYWEQLLAVVGPESEFGKQVASSVDEARVLGKLGPAKVAAAGKAEAKGAAKPSASGPTITGTVTIAPALAKQVAAGDTLFIFARPADGGRMPVAIVKASAGALPFMFTLDDSSAMSPSAKLSTQAKVVVEARISKSGDAMPKKGDLRGAGAPVAPGATGLQVVIDTVVE